MRRPAFDIYRALVGIQDRLMQLAPEDRIRLQRHAVQKYGTAGRAVELVGGHLDEARQSLQGWRRRTSASHRRPLGLRVHAACGGREDLATVWPWITYAPLSASLRSRSLRYSREVTSGGAVPRVFAVLENEASRRAYLVSRLASRRSAMASATRDALSGPRTSM